MTLGWAFQRTKFLNVTELHSLTPHLFLAQDHYLASFDQDFNFYVPCATLSSNKNIWKGKLGIKDANRIHFAQNFVVKDDIKYMFVD